MAQQGGSGSLSVWMKVSSATIACFSLLAFESYVFLSLPTSTKYKVYRFQFGIVLNIVFYFGSKYIWKRLVIDIFIDSSLNLMQFLWKCSVISFLAFAHVSPFTNYFVDREPSMFNMTSWTCFGAYIGLFFVLISLSSIFKILNKATNRRWISKEKQAIASVIFVGYFSWVAFEVARSPPVIISVDIPIAKLPHSFDRMKVVLISDVHLGPTVGFSKLDRVVKMSNKLNPDMIVFAGDLMDVTVEDANGAASPLAALKAPYGKYFSTGNHEYYTGDVENWFNILEEYGFTVLHNTNRKVRNKENKDDWFCILGTDDIQANQISYKGHGMNLTQAYDGCSSDHAAILIAHQPKAAKEALDSDYSIQLVLSGHTHGGQIYPIIWLTYLVNPFLSGLYQYSEDSYVYVSQGSVYYGFPLRLGTRPEITSIILRSK